MFYDQGGITIHQGDCLDILRDIPSGSVNCCITSPPFWRLRDYGMDDQIGLEDTPAGYVSRMVEVFSEVHRVLCDDGTVWLNLGDSYASNGRNRSVEQSTKDTSLDGGTATQCQTLSQQSKVVDGLKPKDLVGIPWRVAFALQDSGWYLRQDIIWHKPSPMPESVTDRCTKAHEYIFLLSKSRRYYFDSAAIAEPCTESNASRPRMGQGPNTQYNQKRKSMKMPDGWGTGPGGHGSFHRNGREKGRQDNAELPSTKNKRSVWTVPSKPYKDAHFAVFPLDLIEPCVLAGCPEGGVVLDPFIGSGTTAEVAKYNGRKCIGIELNPEYCELIPKRLEQGVLF